MTRDELEVRFARYRGALDEADWRAMCDAFERPLPSTLWVNQTRAAPESVASQLIADGHPVSPLAFVPGGYRSMAPARWGRRVEYRAGLVHLQEASSMLPPLALNPQPGELVLDLCAAPGGKSAQIASLMKHTGTLIVNDLSFERLRALRATQERLGLRNMVLCAQDGRRLLSGHPPIFDKVLVDAPCSCEGTLRKRGKWTFDPDDHSFKESLIETQRALLLQALRLTRAGGRVVYSTCTLDPDENEGVVASALESWRLERERGDVDYDVILERLELPGLCASEGLTAWRGASWSEELRHTRRIYPHQNDTGGFFLASLRVEARGQAAINRAARDVESALQRWTQPPTLDDEIEREYLDWVEETYGLTPEYWEGVKREARLLRGNQRTLSLVNRDLRLPPTRYQVAGLPVIYTRGALPRLTSPAALEWGAAATTGVCELETRDQVDDYYRGERQMIHERSLRPHAGVIGSPRSGVYITRYQELPLGLSYLTRDPQHAERSEHLRSPTLSLHDPPLQSDLSYSLKSEYPKRWRLTAGRSAFEPPLNVADS